MHSLSRSYIICMNNYYMVCVSCMPMYEQLLYVCTYVCICMYIYIYIYIYTHNIKCGRGHLNHRGAHNVRRSVSVQVAKLDMHPWPAGRFLFPQAGGHARVQRPCTPFKCLFDLGQNCFRYHMDQLCALHTMCLIAVTWCVQCACQCGMLLTPPIGRAYILRAAGMLCPHPLLISANNNVHHVRPLYFGSRGRTFLRQQLINPFLRYVDGARCAIPIWDWSNPVGLRRLPGHYGRAPSNHALASFRSLLEVRDGCGESGCGLGPVPFLDRGFPHVEGDQNSHGG